MNTVIKQSFYKVNTDAFIGIITIQHSKAYHVFDVPNSDGKIIGTRCEDGIPLPTGKCCDGPNTQYMIFQHTYTLSRLDAL